MSDSSANKSDLPGIRSIAGRFPDYIDGVDPVEYVRSLRDNPTERIAELEAVRKLAPGRGVGCSKAEMVCAQCAYDALDVTFGETLDNA